ncbi:MAG: amidohydrolase [Clostridiales bacterium]|jgi:5-methylthioadenosine/S-adenosylhomocysteine deaminase|nr:amidohydrolase [Clostridiales bacterium]
MGILIKTIKAVLPQKDDIFTIGEHSVYIQDDCIAGIDNKPEGFEADTIIDGSGKLLIPGLINAHTHAYMTIFRNYADDLDFSDWLFQNIMPLEDKLIAGDTYWGTLLSYMEMLKTGTTCSLDMYMFPDEAARAQQETGIRAVMTRGLSGSKDSASGGERRLNEAIAEIKKWKDRPNLTFMLGPHSPYTCDAGYLREVADLSKELGVGLSIHVSESKDEIEQIKEEYGCSPVEHLYKLDVLGESTVAAHCVHLSRKDIEILAVTKTNVATNPVSNLKLGNGIAPIPELLRSGVNVCLGTDSAASNNALNMFRDLSFLALLHKGVTGDAKMISAAQGLKIATVNGAKALGLAGVTGVIKEGMKADLVIIDMQKTWLKPSNNELAALVYSSTGTEVDTVLVNGKILLQNGACTTIDEERVYYEVEKICKRIGMRG